MKGIVFYSLLIICFKSVPAYAFIDELIDQIWGFQDVCNATQSKLPEGYSFQNNELVENNSFKGKITYYRSLGGHLVPGYPEDWFAIHTPLGFLMNLSGGSPAQMEVINRENEEEKKAIKVLDDLIWIREALHERKQDISDAIETDKIAQAALFYFEHPEVLVTDPERYFIDQNINWDVVFQRIERNAVLIDVINRGIEKLLKTNICGDYYSKSLPKKLDQVWGACLEKFKEKTSDYAVEDERKAIITLFRVRESYFKETPILQANPELIDWAGEALDPGTHDDLPLFSLIPRAEVGSAYFRKVFREQLGKILNKAQKKLEKKFNHYDSLLTKGNDVNTKEQYLKYYETLTDDTDTVDELTVSTNPIQKRELSIALTASECRMRERILAHGAGDVVRDTAINAALMVVPFGIVTTAAGMGLRGTVALSAVTKTASWASTVGFVSVSSASFYKTWEHCSDLQNLSVEKSLKAIVQPQAYREVIDAANMTQECFAGLNDEIFDTLLIAAGGQALSYALPSIINEIKTVYKLGKARIRLTRIRPTRAKAKLHAEAKGSAGHVDLVEKPPELQMESPPETVPSEIEVRAQKELATVKGADVPIKRLKAVTDIMDEHFQNATKEFAVNENAANSANPKKGSRFDKAKRAARARRAERQRNKRLKNAVQPGDKNTPYNQEVSDAYERELDRWNEDVRQRINSGQEISDEESLALEAYRAGLEIDPRIKADMSQGFRPRSNLMKKAVGRLKGFRTQRLMRKIRGLIKANQPVLIKADELERLTEVLSGVIWDETHVSHRPSVGYKDWGKGIRALFNRTFWSHPISELSGPVKSRFNDLFKGLRATYLEREEYVSRRMQAFGLDPEFNVIRKNFGRYGVMGTLTRESINLASLGRVELYSPRMEKVIYALRTVTDSALLTLDISLYPVTVVIGFSKGWHRWESAKNELNKELVEQHYCVEDEAALSQRKYFAGIQKKALAELQKADHKLQNKARAIFSLVMTLDSNQEDFDSLQKWRVPLEEALQNVNRELQNPVIKALPIFSDVLLRYGQAVQAVLQELATLRAIDHTLKDPELFGQNENDLQALQLRREILIKQLLAQVIDLQSDSAKFSSDAARFEPLTKPNPACLEIQIKNPEIFKKPASELKGFDLDDDLMGDGE